MFFCVSKVIVLLGFDHKAVHFKRGLAVVVKVDITLERHTVKKNKFFTFELV